MRISEQGRARVRPRDFWLGVLIGTLVLSGVGLYTGHVPAASPEMTRFYHGFEIIFLSFLWGAFLVRSMRSPRRVYTLMNVVILVGSTLFFGSDLIPSLGSAADWVKNTGMFLIFVSILSDWITFGKRRPPTQTVDTPSRPAS